MDFTAYLAFESTEDSYDIYRSGGGGYDYSLYPRLEEYTEGTISNPVDGLSELSSEKSTNRLHKESTPIDLSGGELISSDPIATSVPTQELLFQIPVYEAELLYVVSDTKVEILVPVVINPLSMYSLYNIADLRLYKPDRGRRDTLQLMKTNHPSDCHLIADQLAPSHLQDIPSWAIQILEQGHRYFLHRCKQMMYNEESNRDLKRMILTAGGAEIQLATDTEYTLTDAALPIRVPWADDGPKYKIHNNLDVGIGPAAKIHASRLRYTIYPSVFKQIGRAQSDKELSEVVSTFTDVLIDQIDNVFGDDLALEYVPDEFAETIKKE